MKFNKNNNKNIFIQGCFQLLSNTAKRGSLCVECANVFYKWFSTFNYRHFLIISFVTGYPWSRCFGYKMLQILYSSRDLVLHLMYIYCISMAIIFQRCMFVGWKYSYYLLLCWNGHSPDNPGVVCMLIFSWKKRSHIRTYWQNIYRLVLGRVWGNNSSKILKKSFCQKFIKVWAMGAIQNTHIKVLGK